MGQKPMRKLWQDGQRVKDKPEDVKVIQVVTAMQHSAIDKHAVLNLMVIGLGDDGLLYLWDSKTHKWIGA